MTRRYTRLIAFARSRFQLGTLREETPFALRRKELSWVNSFNVPIAVSSLKL